MGNNQQQPVRDSTENIRATSPESRGTRRRGIHRGRLNAPQEREAVQYTRQQGYTRRQIEIIQQVVDAPRTGTYKGLTADRVAQWQLRHNLKPDGKVGPRTRDAMARQLEQQEQSEKGSRGDRRYGRVPTSGGENPPERATAGHRYGSEPPLEDKQSEQMRRVVPTLGFKVHDVRSTRNATVEVVFNNAITLNMARKYIWPGSYKPPDIVLQPPPREPDARRGGAPLWDSFLLNTANLILQNRHEEWKTVYQEMRNNIRQMVIDSFTEAQERERRFDWPSYIPKDMQQTLNERLASGWTGVQRLKSSEFYPSPAVLVSIQGTGGLRAVYVFPEAPTDATWWANKARQNNLAIGRVGEFAARTMKTYNREVKYLLEQGYSISQVERIMTRENVKQVKILVGLWVNVFAAPHGLTSRKLTTRLGETEKRFVETANRLRQSLQAEGSMPSSGEAMEEARKHSY